MKYQFSKDFTFGAASSGLQTEGASKEGGREPHVWDKFHEMSPHLFHNNVGPGVCSDFYHRYKEEIPMMKEIGLTSFRTSIQWGRLLPYGSKEPAPDAIRFYNDMIDTLLDNGVKPYICLQHTDLPWSIQERGGWENRETTNDFEFYAQTCFKLFGDKVKDWFTFNEPIVVPLLCYSGVNNWYPGVIDLQRGMNVAYHSMLAHAKAVDIFRQNGHSGKIGVVVNLSPAYPRSQHPEDLEAARLANLFHNGTIKEPALKGIINQDLIKFMHDNKMTLPINNGDEAIFSKGIGDMMGLNYYTPQRVKAKEHLVNPKAPISPYTFYDNYELPGRRMNVSRGWEIYPQGIYDTLIDLKNNYGNLECIISENGMGVQGEENFRNSSGYIEDDYRIEFIKEHLSYVHKAIQEGSNCRGYHLWTFVDNWSPMNAYKNRYGFIELQRDNNLKRVIKKSGYWMKEVTKTNSFEWEAPSLT